MALKLVSSDDGPALAIRNHVVPLIRARGTLEVQRDTVRLTVLQIEELTFEHWTPFNDPSPEDAASPGYRHALTHQHTLRDLPYGLDVWLADLRVMRLLWADCGTFDVVDFVRGAWETEALAL